MPHTRVTLSEAHLVYPPGEEVHTAASGFIAALHEYYVRIEDRECRVGDGEIRANIAFITHTPEEAVAPGIAALARSVDWSLPWREILARLSEFSAGHPKIARAALENALVDGIARADG